MLVETGHQGPMAYGGEPDTNSSTEGKCLYRQGIRTPCHCCGSESLWQPQSLQSQQLHLLWRVRVFLDDSSLTLAPEHRGSPFLFSIDFELDRMPSLAQTEHGHPVRWPLEDFASISYWFFSLPLRKCDYTKPNSGYIESRVKLHQSTTSPVTRKLHPKLLSLTVICSMVLVGKWLPYLASYLTLCNIHLKEYT